MRGSLVVSFNKLYEFSGESLSAVTKFEPFKLTPIESETLAVQSDDLVYELFPQMTGKVAKVLVFVLTLVGVYGSRWIKYEHERAKREKAKKQSENKDVKVVEGLNLENV